MGRARDGDRGDGDGDRMMESGKLYMTSKVITWTYRRFKRKDHEGEGEEERRKRIWPR